MIRPSKERLPDTPGRAVGRSHCLCFFMYDSCPSRRRRGEEKGKEEEGKGEEKGEEEKEEEE